MSELKNIFIGKDEDTIVFYGDAIRLLQDHQAKYLLGGGLAFYHHTGIRRASKDLDLFCTFHDFPGILKLFKEEGYHTEVPDSRWIGKVFSGGHYIDVIFDTPSGLCPVDDSWFDRASGLMLEGVPMKVLSPEELIWCKLYIQNRERFDGADINHLLLLHGRTLDWQHLMRRVDRHWHLLLAQLLNFQFVYPSEYKKIIPKSLFDELIRRAEEQYVLPASTERICRGPLLDQTQYGVDIREWDFKVVTMKTV